MVLVLQRQVLVMGPMIILHGAIPIDSNIGGSGHRPLSGEVVLHVLVLVVSCLPFVVSSLCVLSPVSAFCCVHLLVVCFAKALLFSRVLETCIFLSTRYYRGLPQYYRVRSARYFRTQRGSNFLLPPGGAVLPPTVQYFRPGGTTAMTCGTTALSRARGG